MAENIRTRYSDAELAEFKKLILEKLEEEEGYDRIDDFKIMRKDVSKKRIEKKITIYFYLHIIK